MRQYLQCSANKQATSALSLRQGVKQEKLPALYKHLNVRDDLDLINLDRFNSTKNTKKGTTVLEFYTGDKWVPLTKQTDEFLASKTSRAIFVDFMT